MMSYPTGPADIYSRRSEETLALWQKDRGKENPLRGEFYPESLKAIATGIQPRLSQSIVEVLERLQALTAGDANADVMQIGHFHLTFLAITPAIFDDNNVPEQTAELKHLFAQHCGDRPLTVHELRLVALPNQLLLAGYPDDESVQRRQAFWRALQHSSFAEQLKQRYPGSDQPPAFWHSTLLRYHAGRLPPYVQDFFIAQQTARYGTVSGNIKLRLVTYNWSVAETILGLPQ